ncbi:hypothetical protein C5167_023307 [Papaver somniferum]|uniref:Uncharacterized protein n=1 Tax=Papaver somniferum TaxID=3469 RepID=A0A4Y7JP87_PAPSO|nr:hypothetical protein C5167_023307 [Papaver somniferum]
MGEVSQGIAVPREGGSLCYTATSAHSIDDAARMIQFGDSNVMVAGGTEFSDALSITGFCR